MMNIQYEIRAEHKAQLLAYIEELRFLNSVYGLQGIDDTKIPERIDHVLSCLESLVNKIIKSGKEDTGDC